MELIGLKKTIPSPPLEWVSTAPSTMILVRMLAVWDSCQLAIAEVPPSERDLAWAQRHLSAYRSYECLRIDGVPGEASLEDFAKQMGTWELNKSGHPRWPYSDLIEVPDDYTICKDAGVTEGRWEQVLAQHERLMVCKETALAATDLILRKLELDRLLVIESVLTGLLEARGWGGVEIQGGNEST